MNALQQTIDYWNRKVRKLTIIDIKFIQIYSMAVILIVVKLIPDIMRLSIWWFVALLILSALRPYYTFFIKPDPESRPPA